MFQSPILPSIIRKFPYEEIERMYVIENKGVCHIVALPFTLKNYLNTKEDLRKCRYFTMKKYNLKK
jgi:hypothetical protein